MARNALLLCFAALPAVMCVPMDHEMRNPVPTPGPTPALAEARGIGASTTASDDSWMNGILSSIVGANPSLVIITKDGTPMATLLSPAPTGQPQPTAAQPPAQKPPAQSQPVQSQPAQGQPAQNPPAQNAPPAAVPSTGVPLYTTIMTIIGPWAPPQTGSPQQVAGTSQIAAQSPPAPTPAASTKSTQTPYHRKTATGPGGELGGLLSTVIGGVEGIGQALGGAGGSQTAAPGPSIPASEIPPGFSPVPRAEPTPTSLSTAIRER